MALVVYIQFARPDGFPVYVKRDAIQMVTSTSELGGKARSMIRGAGGDLYVRETVDQVMDRIRESSKE